MKRSTAMILAALVLSTATLSGCTQSGNNNAASAPSDTSTAASSQDSSAAESTESEISNTESSVVSEAASAESSEENSKTSKAESSDNKSKTESSKTKTEEKSKPESSKPETSKTETSKAETSKTETSKTETSNTETSKAETSKAETSKAETSKTETSKTEEVKATGISIDLSTLSLTAGYGQELNAYILWSNNTSSYQGITWSSSNSSVASVSSTGYVTAKSAGTATITASYGSYSKSCTVTVKAAQQQSSQSSGGSTVSGNYNIQFDGSSEFDVYIGYNFNIWRTLSVVEDGRLGGSSDVQFIVADPSIATIDASGIITGKKAGTTTITAKYRDKSATCKVTVKANENTGNSGNSGNNGSGSTQTYVPFDKSSHKKVYSPKGYEMYEVPEIVEYINVYRRQLGLSDVTWIDTPENRQALINEFNSMSEDELNECREYYGDEVFNNDGTFNIDKYEEYQKKTSTRAALEYCLDTQTLQHGGQHESMINGLGSNVNDVKEWVDKIKTNSPMHWDILMKPKLRTIYWVVYVTAEGVIYSVN